MFDLEKVIDKLLSKQAEQRDKRVLATDVVVEKSRKAREHSRRAVQDAYRMAGEEYGRRD